MSISVTRNDDDSYTVTCGAESVTVGGRDGGGGDRPPGRPKGGSGGGGGGSITPTEGGVVAAIVASEKGHPIEILPYTGLELVSDPALWLRIEMAKYGANPIGSKKKAPVLVGWKGYGKMDLTDLAVGMKEMGYTDRPILIRGMPPKVLK